MLLSSEAYAADVTLAWDANTEEDLAGYNLHYGITSGNYTQHIDVGNVIEYTITGIDPYTTYYYAATAYDVDGNESDYSNEVIYTVSAIPENKVITLVSVWPSIDRVTYVSTSDNPAEIEWTEIPNTLEYEVTAYHYERENLPVAIVHTQNTSASIYLGRTGHYTFKVVAHTDGGGDVVIDQSNWWIYLTPPPPDIIIE